MTDRIVEENIETIIEVTVMIAAGTDLEKGHFPEAITTIEIGVQPIIGPGQDQEQVHSTPPIMKLPLTKNWL